MNEKNVALLCDFYEFTMGNGYFLTGKTDKSACFDVYFRKVPDGGGYVIAAGLDAIIDFIDNLKFTDEDIEMLRNKKIFDEGFLSYLKNFKFECDVYAVPEGTPVFPNEPIITVKGPAVQAQFLETMLLLLTNHQSLIATKASRICRAAAGRPVFEFGTRRAQGTNAAVMGARAAYIGGCMGTACAICESLYGIPAVGTMAHSWVQMYDSELEAFEEYARLYPDNCTLLIDTYNVLKSGLPNAIKTYEEVLRPMGKRLAGVRIDSGDVAYLTKKTRKILDDAGLTDCKIFVSNSLDEYIIRDILSQGAVIDFFGVGERLITSKSEPVLGGVYKLSGVEEEGRIIPKIKVSDNTEKITNPGFKTFYRIYDNATGKAEADLIALRGEKIDFSKPLTLYHPIERWKKITFENYTARELPVAIIKGGKLVYDLPKLKDIRAYAAKEMDSFWEEYKRLDQPHVYKVDLSDELYALKTDMLDKVRRGENV